MTMDVIVALVDGVKLIVWFCVLQLEPEYTIPSYLTVPAHVHAQASVTDHHGNVGVAVVYVVPLVSDGVQGQTVSRLKALFAVVETLPSESL